MCTNTSECSCVLILSKELKCMNSFCAIFCSTFTVTTYYYLFVTLQYKWQKHLQTIFTIYCIVNGWATNDDDNDDDTAVAAAHVQSMSSFLKFLLHILIHRTVLLNCGPGSESITSDFKENKNIFCYLSTQFESDFWAICAFCSRNWSLLTSSGFPRIQFASKSRALICFFHFSITLFVIVLGDTNINFTFIYLFWFCNYAMVQLQQLRSLVWFSKWYLYFVA